MKGVQCYELFGGIALKNHTFSFCMHINAFFKKGHHQGYDNAKPCTYVQSL